MPLIIPKTLPAYDALYEENVFVMHRERALSQHIRPLEILILNLMPTKIATETQIARLLANTPIQVHMTLLQTASHAATHVSAAHLEAFYKTFDEVKNNRYDGMIITGAPVEKIDYRHNSPAKAEPVYRELKMQVSQSKMVMAFKSDYEDIYTAKLFCMLLGATPFSKLFANVREKMSLCYYCSSAYADRKGTLFIDSGVESCNIEKAKKAIEEQLEAICNGDFTEEELENTKKSLCGGFKSNYDSIYDIMGWYAAQNTRNTAFTPEEINERIAKLTREDIISCAKTFKPDTVFVIRGEEEEDCDE